jgi:hypothetical protein
MAGRQGQNYKLLQWFDLIEINNQYPNGHNFTQR